MIVPISSFVKSYDDLIKSDALKCGFSGRLSLTGVDKVV